MLKAGDLGEESMDVGEGMRGLFNAMTGYQVELAIRRMKERSVGQCRQHRSSCVIQKTWSMFETAGRRDQAIYARQSS